MNGRRRVGRAFQAKAKGGIGIRGTSGGVQSSQVVSALNGISAHVDHLEQTLVTSGAKIGNTKDPADGMAQVADGAARGVVKQYRANDTRLSRPVV